MSYVPFSTPRLHSPSSEAPRPYLVQERNHAIELLGACLKHPLVRQLFVAVVPVSIGRGRSVVVLHIHNLLAACRLM